MSIIKKCDEPCKATRWQKERKMQTEWRSFQGGAWETEVNVRDFIQKNYTPYEGDSSFLAKPTAKTEKLWKNYYQKKSGKLIIILVNSDKKLEFL